MIRAILDEGTPKKLASLLAAQNIEASAFPNRWKGTLNGRLLDLVEEAGFSCLVSCDKRVPFQQNLSGRQIALIILPTPELDVLSAEIETIADAIRAAKAGQVTTIRFKPKP